MKPSYPYRTGPSKFVIENKKFDVIKSCLTSGMKEVKFCIEYDPITELTVTLDSLGRIIVADHPHIPVIPQRDLRNIQESADQILCTTRFGQKMLQDPLHTVPGSRSGDKIPRARNSTCNYCQCPATFHCSQCLIIMYCGNRCQKKDWREHKLDCQWMSQFPKKDWKNRSDSASL